MKRFLAIFGICFAAIIVFFVAYLGILYLNGEFNPEIIMPENIAFEQSEYLLEDGQNAQITITTTTENVTEKNVRLVLSKNCTEIILSDQTKCWTDGVIIIPKTATIGEPFWVMPYKDDTYSSELPEESALLNYVKGGISTIIATSKNNLISPASTSVYVDVPVLKTELVVYNGIVNGGSLNSSFNMVEHSMLASNASDINNIVNINAGDKFYMGIKFYPSASAIKYSRATSTNMLVEYKNQILEKLESLGLSDLHESFETAFSSETIFGPEIADGQAVMATYSVLHNSLVNSGNEELNTYLLSLSELFYKNLKYTNLIQKNSDEQENVTINGRILGTNIYECTASQNLGEVDFYTYSFKMAGKEDIAFALMEEGDDILQLLEQEYEKENVFKTAGYLNIVDVEVDTISMSGSIENFFPNTVHTVYATKDGQNTYGESYLKIKLSNSNIPDINLQNGIKNVGIRFEVKQGVNWVDASEIIKIKNSDLYTTFVVDGKTYYAPFGTSNYWEIYSENFVDGMFRAIIKYFAPTGDVNNPYIIGAEIAESKLPQYILVTKEEKMVSWLDTKVEDLNIVNIEGVLNANGEAVNVSTNEEYDLSNNVNRQVLNQNTYTTIKYFVYCDDASIKLSQYFETVNVDGIEYTFNDGSIKNLYELTSSVIKLKDINNIPASSVKAIFITVKTDMDGKPIMNAIDPNKYEYAKYSAVQDNLLERLSFKEFNFVASIRKLSAEMTIRDDNNAGVVDGKLLVAQNAQNVLNVAINCDEIELFEEAINSEKITVVAKQTTSNAENYIELGNGILTAGKIVYPISTISVSRDIDLQLYVVYTVNGNSYLFPVSYTYQDEPTGVDATLNSFTVVKNINSTASFVVYSDYNTKSEFDLETVDYIEVSTEFTTEIAYVYMLYFKDGTNQKINSNQLFDENGNLYVDVKNFLNKVGADRWTLTTNNAQVATIDTETGKKVDFISNGEVQISLLLDGVINIQDSLKFKIANEGFVSNYVTNDKYGRQISTFTPNSPYESKTIILSVDGTNGKQITLEDTETEVNKTNALFAMWYKLGAGTDDIKRLSFNVRLADSQSQAVYKAITGNDAGNELSSFELNKNLGETVVLHLVYVNEDLNISQKITLNILWSVSVSVFAIKDGITGEELTATNAEYTIYAGYEYTFEASISNGASPYYYILSETGEKIATTSNAQSIVKFVDYKYIFADVDSQKQFQIYISDKSADLNIGDLQYLIKINVRPNIKIQSSIENAGNRYNVYLGEDGIVAIPYSTLFQRRVGNYTLDISKFKIASASNGISPSGNGIQISLSSVVNSAILTLNVSYADYSLAEISITVFVNNFEKGTAERVAKYNNEKAIILVVGDRVDANGCPNVLLQQFEPNAVVSIIGRFNEYIADSAVAVMSNTLFRDTNCYASVSDSKGNQTRYKLIISQLPYPFVNFGFDPLLEKTNKDLDVNKLFESLDKADLEEYYYQCGVYAGADNYFGENNIELLQGVFNFGEDENITLDMPQIGNEDVAEFAHISGTQLVVSEVGRESISILVVLRYKKSANVTYSIPAVIRVYQSQKLHVKYPYSSDKAEDIQNYGSDEYDNEHMFEQTSPFANTIMEYAGIKITGESIVVLDNSKFEVVVKDNNSWVIDSDYSGGFNFSVSKVFVNVNRVWSEISEENIAKYVEINGNKVIFATSGVNAIRAKILVETTKGGASNYYYIQVGETEEFKLYKKAEGIDTQINYEDSINVAYNNTIAIGADDGADFNYYTKEYSEHLKFEILGEPSLYNLNGNKIEIKISPNASKLVIKVFTIYGEVARLNINISAYYKAEMNNIKLFGGTKVAIGDIISIKMGSDVVDPLLISDLSLGDIEVEEYSVVGNYIEFKASETQYKISCFECYIMVDGLPFYILIDEEITIYPPITIKQDVLQLDEQTENGGKITISKNIWGEAFSFDYTDNGLAIPVDNISYRIVCNNQTKDYNSTDIDDDIDFDFGVITNQTTADFVLQVVFGDIIISTRATMLVKPQYNLILNYPNGKTKTFDREYIQIGSKVDFYGGVNINGNPRITFTNTADGSTQPYQLVLRGSSLIQELSIPMGNKFDTNDLSKGTYEAVVIYNNKEYGSYVIELIEGNPITIDTTNIEGKTFYAGHGSDDVFNYVDIIADMPTNIVGLNHAKAFSFYAKTGEDTYEQLTKTLYYNGTDMNRTYRFEVDLGIYSKGVNSGNIYVGYQDNNNRMQYFICRNASIFERVSIMYQGAEIDVTILKDNNLVSISLENIMDNDGNPTNRYRFGLAYDNSDIVAGDEAKQYGEYTVECDIQLTKQEIDGVHLVLNANEYPDGLSFIDLFEVRDLNNKKFWYNNVGEGATLTLRYASTESAGNMRALLITDRVFNGTTYDYNLKALGAKNNGTIVELELIYAVGEVSFKDTVKIKVISDMVVSLLNNDNYVTENSETNPLILSYSGQSLILADKTQSDNRNNRYYIWAYSKYDTAQKNVAQTIEPIKVGDETLETQVEVSVTNGNLVFKYPEKPEFGDKYITLTFVDNYGYTFTYFITLIAETRVVGVTMNKEVYFEGETIAVTNKNNAGTNATGVILDIRATDNIIYSGVVYVSNVIVESIGDKQQTIDKDDIFNEGGVGDYSFELKNMPQGFWKEYGNGLSVSLKIKFMVKTDLNSSEAYEVVRTIDVLKRYELSVKQENSYVRDGQEFNVAQIVSIYDYQRRAYLAEPEIEKADVLKVEFAINNSYVIKPSEDTILTAVDDDGEQTSFGLLAGASGSEINLLDLMDARQGGGYSSLDGKIYEVQDDGTIIDTEEKDWTPAIADAILGAVGIKYTAGSGFKISLLVKATNRKNNNIFYVDKLSEIGLEPDGENYKAIDYVYLNGKKPVFHGTVLDKNEYIFELIPLDYIVHNAEQPPSIAKFTDGTCSDGANENPIVSKISINDNILSLTTISELKVEVYNTVNIILEAGSDLYEYQVKAGQSSYDLKEGYFVGKDVQIYTGEYNRKSIYNGFDEENAKKAKNILEINMSEGNSLSLIADNGFSYDSKNKINYQTIIANIAVKFISHGNADPLKHTYESPVRVTTLYTGVDPRAGAYVGNAIAKYIEIKQNDINGKIDNNGVLTRPVEVEFDTWSAGFELVPGIGYFAKLSAGSNEDMTFGNAALKGSIVFEFAGIAVDPSTGTADNTTEIPNVKLESNMLKLSAGFALLEKYVAINVLCNYPSEGEKSEEPLLIGTIYLGFAIKG